MPVRKKKSSSPKKADPFDARDKETVRLVNHALQQKDLRQLRQLSAVRGLVNNGLRARVWGLLCGADPDLVDDATFEALATCQHRDRQVVKVDVERSLWSFMPNASPPTLEAKRAQLARLLNAVVGLYATPCPYPPQETSTATPPPPRAHRGADQSGTHAAGGNSGSPAPAAPPAGPSTDPQQLPPPQPLLSRPLDAASSPRTPSPTRSVAGSGPPGSPPISSSSSCSSCQRQGGREGGSPQQGGRDEGGEGGELPAEQGVGKQGGQQGQAEAEEGEGGARCVFTSAGGGGTLPTPLATRGSSGGVDGRDGGVNDGGGSADGGVGLSLTGLRRRRGGGGRPGGHDNNSDGGHGGVGGSAGLVIDGGGGAFVGAPISREAATPDRQQQQQQQEQQQGEESPAPAPTAQPAHESPPHTPQHTPPPPGPPPPSHQDVYYYQGLHDVASLLLLTTGSERAAFPLLARLASTHLRDATRPSLDGVLETLGLLPALLRAADPELADHLSDLELPPFFSLSWVITWWAHTTDKVQDAARLFDLFLASHPLTPMYVGVVAMRAARGRLLECEEMPELHSALANLRLHTLDPKALPEVGGGDGVGRTHHHHHHHHHHHRAASHASPPPSRHHPVLDKVAAAALQLYRDVPPQALVRRAKCGMVACVGPAAVLEGGQWQVPSTPPGVGVAGGARLSTAGVGPMALLRFLRRLAAHARLPGAGAPPAVHSAAVDGRGAERGGGGGGGDADDGKAEAGQQGAEKAGVNSRRALFHTALSLTSLAGVYLFATYISYSVNSQHGGRM